MNSMFFVTNEQTKKFQATGMIGGRMKSEKLYFDGGEENMND